jgi:hypothetical protein
MDLIFIDSSAWYALANQKDVNHLSARHFLNRTSRLVTSNFIIDETITLTLIRAGYKSALTVGEQLWLGDIASIAWITRKDEQKAWAFFKQYSDKIFSFTDCTSFALMTRPGINQAFTFDADFSQTGQFTSVP